MNYWENVQEQMNNTSLIEVIEMFKYKIGNISSVGGWFPTITVLKNHNKEIRADIKALKLLKADIDLAIEESLIEIELNKNRIEKIRTEKNESNK